MAQFINFKTKDKHHLINLDDISSITFSHKGDFMVAVTKGGGQWDIQLKPGEWSQFVVLDKLTTVLAKDAELCQPNGDQVVSKEGRREEYEKIEAANRIAKLEVEGEL